MKLSTQSFSVFSRVMKLSTQSFSVFLRVMKLFHPVRWCHFGVEDHSTPIVARSLGVLCVPAAVDVVVVCEVDVRRCYQC